MRKRKGLERLNKLNHNMPPVPIHPPAIVGFSSEQSLSQTTGTERKWNCDAAAPQATQQNQLRHTLPPEKDRVLTLNKYKTTIYIFLG